MKKVNFLLMGFTSNATYPVRAIAMPVYLGEGWNALTINVSFIVVDASDSYNAILGHSTLNPHRMVHSTNHQLMKLSTRHEIGVLRGDQPVAHNCYVHAVHRHVLKKKETLLIQMDEDPREEISHPQLVEGLMKVELDEPKKVVHIGPMLP